MQYNEIDLAPGLIVLNVQAGPWNNDPPADSWNDEYDEICLFALESAENIGLIDNQDKAFLLFIYIFFKLLKREPIVMIFILRHKN